MGAGQRVCLFCVRTVPRRGGGGAGVVQDVPGINHNHRDVVAAAVPQRSLDQGIGGVLRVAHRADDAEDVLVRHFAGESVRADQDTVAFLHGEQPVVGLGLVPGAQGAGDNVAPRMDGGLLGGDLARIHKFLHLRVVHADLLKPPLAEAVRTGIADVHDQPVGQAHLFHYHCTGQGGPRPGTRSLPDGRVRPEQVLLERRGRDGAFPRCELRNPCQGPHAHAACHFACFVAAHPVRNGEHRIGSKVGIFVQLPAESPVRAIAVAQAEARLDGGGNAGGLLIHACPR